ncbi:NTP transferase domain-containing protein [Pectinatus brassicae]|uniref:CTP:molybdopterin cytidylyltransferase MocA n=1 Tax=Pectinatus brassicae TaxID=862415 RepID=A0A840URH5_9FIRM|nr:nucleotidyltransferase family protein [Pectinatus brassicae]MBB5335593.1 CTP:molybdopterin cytidylyltransferase MocA [Pectinatus brassicae]
MLGAVVAAAGLSSRMGDFKPLLPYKKKTILAATIDKLSTSGVEEIIIVVGYRHKDIEQYFSSYSNVKFIYNPYYREKDMLYSLQCGLKTINNVEAVLLLPADMPAISQQTFVGLIDCWKKSKSGIVLPVQNGRQKHPALISNKYFADILAFSGDGGLRSILQGLAAETFYLAIADDGLNFDVDTPAEYQQLLGLTTKDD